MITGFGNNTASTLASDITANQTSITLVPGAGESFAKLLTTDISNPSSPHKIYSKLTLTDSQQTVFEICHLISVSNDTLTVIRGQEGTVAKGWALNDVIANFATRGSEQSFVQIEQLQGGDFTSATAGGTPNALAISLPSTFSNNNTNDWLLKTPILVTPIATNSGAATLQLTMGGRVLGTYPLVKGSNTELRAGDIVAKSPFLMLFNAEQDRFTLLNPTTNVGAVLTVNSRAPDAAGNVKLGTAADADVGTASGNVMAVGAFGLGRGSNHKADAYNNVGEIYRVNSTSANTPTTGVTGVISLPCDGGPSTAYAAVSNSGAAWVGSSSIQASGIQWNRVYTTAYKPTADDVGALSINGGTIGATGLTSNGDITANGRNIILKKGTSGGGYYLQDSTGKNLALISATDTGDVTISSLIAGGSLRYNGAMFASNARFNTDGNVNGSVWNGWLSDYLTTELDKKATYDYVNGLKNTSGNGWWKDTATGIIFQWGFVQSDTSNAEYAVFNISFPNNSLAVVANLGTAISNGQTVYTNATNNRGFDYKTSGSKLGFTWIAIGY